MIEHITHKDRLLSIIIRRDFKKPAITFFTPKEFPMQVAYMSHPAGRTVKAHTHAKIPRTVYYTQEVLILKRGRMRVDFYDENRKYLESRVLKAGDVILLASGGHGFEVLEEIEMIEVKQGPYQGDTEKTRFPDVTKSNIIIK